MRNYWNYLNIWIYIGALKSGEIDNCALHSQNLIQLSSPNCVSAHIQLVGKSRRWHWIFLLFAHCPLTLSVKHLTFTWFLCSSLWCQALPLALLGKAFGVFVLNYNHPLACQFPTETACFHLFPKLPWQIYLQTHSSGQCGRLLPSMGLQNHRRDTSLHLPRHLPFGLRYWTTTFSLLSPSSPGNSCHPTLTLLENSLSSSRVRREHDFCHYCSSLETLVLSVLHN